MIRSLCYRFRDKPPILHGATTAYVLFTSRETNGQKLLL